jgi:hypothetical protein
MGQRASERLQVRRCRNALPGLQRTEEGEASGAAGGFHTARSRRGHPAMIAPRWAEEETDNPVYADDRNFFKVEHWTDDDLHVERMLYAGNRLDKALDMFDAAIRVEPAARYLIRQRSRVVDKWS